MDICNLTSFPRGQYFKMYSFTGFLNNFLKPMDISFSLFYMLHFSAIHTVTGSYRGFWPSVKEFFFCLLHKLDTWYAVFHQFRHFYVFSSNLHKFKVSNKNVICWSLQYCIQGIFIIYFELNSIFFLLKRLNLTSK